MAVVAAGPHLGSLADRYMVDTPRGPSIPDERQLEFQQAFVTALLDACPAEIVGQIAHAFGLLLHDPVEGPDLWPGLSLLTAPFSKKFKRAIALRDVRPGGRA